MVEINGKENWFEFQNGVFPANVLFFIGTRQEMCFTASLGLGECKDMFSKENARKFVDEIEKSFGREVRGISGECVSCDIDSGMRIWIVRLDRFDGQIDDAGMLSHECLHAALSIMGHCGVSENPPFEGLCYFHEAIYKHFMLKAYERAGLLIRSPEELERRGFIKGGKKKGDAK